MSAWVVINGHVLGQCPYLDDDPGSWQPCDCADLLDNGDDDFWDEDEELIT